VPLEPISKADYLRLPDSSTVLETEGLRLSTYGLVINKELRAVICLECGNPILPPTAIPQHVKRHVSALDLPAGFEDTLIQRFLLGPNVCYPKGIIDPIFGIELLEQPHVFCTPCNRGYRDLKGLQMHQKDVKCSGGYHEGYGQRISGLKHRIIEVNISNLEKKTNVQLDPTSWYRQGIVPSRDYAKLVIHSPENSSNLSSFFHKDGWISHVAGNSADDLYEARCSHTDEDAHGETLRDLARRYLDDIQDDIQDNVNFGLLKDIGSVTLYVIYSYYIFSLSQIT